MSSSRARPLAVGVLLATASLLIASVAASPARPEPSVGTAASSAPESTDPTRSGVAGLAGAGLPTLTPDSVRWRVPTRVRIRDLGIDLPVVAPPDDPDHYPLCNVAEFLPTMSRPGRPGTTFIYAHARAGMFLPILEGSQVRDGRSMIGLQVEVYTSDLRRFEYEVTEVRRHVTSLDLAYRATAEQLILQTSEGPHGTPGKTMLIAAPKGHAAAGPVESRPSPRPVACG